MVCSYLIEECGFAVDTALAAFAAARPPGVKHEKFHQELHRRYTCPQAAHTSEQNGSSSIMPAVAEPRPIPNTAVDGHSGQPDSQPLFGSSSRRESLGAVAGSIDDNSSIGQSIDLTSPSSATGRPESADYFMLNHNSAIEFQARQRLMRPDTAPPLIGGIAEDDVA